MFHDLKQHHWTGHELAGAKWEGVNWEGEAPAEPKPPANPRKKRFPTSLVLTLAAILTSTPAFADQRAANLLPPSTLFYAEVPDPPRVVEFVLTHPVAAHVKSMAVYQEAIESEDAGKFFQGLRYVEEQLGVGWQEAFRQVTANGIALAFDAETDGVALLAQAASESQLAHIQETFVRLAREDAARKGEPMPFEERDYRGVPVYRTDEGGFAVHQRWLVVVNQVELGQQIIDALLDGRDGNLASESDFQNAQQPQSANLLLWMYANIGAVRRSGSAPELFSGKADGPLCELLLGGILEVLLHAPSVSAVLREDGSQLTFDVMMPFDRSWISEVREHYFGTAGQGQAPLLGELPNLIFAVSAYRNVSAMWTRSADLFDEQVSEQIAAADHKLSTLFAGQDFGDDILGSFSPRMQIVIARQTFAADQPVPALKLPAFAMIMEMQNSDGTPAELRRIFQSLIGFLNVVGAADDQPQLRLQSEPLNEGEMHFATFVPQLDDETQTDASIHFNFSPAIAFPSGRMILSSTVELARELSAWDPAPPLSNGECVNLSMLLSADVLTSVLRDNLDRLISQNMEDEGHSRSEATEEVTTLLELLSLLQDVSLTLSTSDDTLTLSLDVDFAGAD